jgi:hypothetical protein
MKTLAFITPYTDTVNPSSRLYSSLVYPCIYHHAQHKRKVILSVSRTQKHSAGEFASQSHFTAHASRTAFLCMDLHRTDVTPIRTDTRTVGRGASGRTPCRRWWWQWCLCTRIQVTAGLCDRQRGSFRCRRTSERRSLCISPCARSLGVSKTQAQHPQQCLHRRPRWTQTSGSRWPRAGEPHSSA